MSAIECSEHGGFVMRVLRSFHLFFRNVSAVKRCPLFGMSALGRFHCIIRFRFDKASNRQSSNNVIRISNSHHFDLSKFLMFMCSYAFQHLDSCKWHNYFRIWSQRILMEKVEMAMQIQIQISNRSKCKKHNLQCIK